MIIGAIADVCGYGHGIITGLLSTKGVIRTDKGDKSDMINRGDKTIDNRDKTTEDIRTVLTVISG